MKRIFFGDAENFTWGCWVRSKNVALCYAAPTICELFSARFVSQLQQKLEITLL